MIRRALGLTQEEFAGRFHIPLGTLRDWEQGAAAPDQSARAYITVIARELLLASGGVVSVQVLNEFVSVATRKLAMTIPEIREILSTIRTVCIVKPLDIETHELGLDMAERYGFSIYDGLTVAAVVHAGCVIFYTEVLQQKQMTDQIVIRNPFSVG